MSADVIYADSSALVKLVITEAETPALRRFLSARTPARLASSELATTEVMRAVLRDLFRSLPLVQGTNFAETILERWAEWERSPADRIRVRSEELSAGREVSGVRLSGGERLSADQVVVAAGAWSGSIDGIPADARVPIHPVKGQILRLHDPAGPGLMSHVVRFGAGYVASMINRL